MTGLRSLRAGDPERVGAYRLVGLLGEGGQGTLYGGVAPSGEPVAVKLLHARFTDDDKGARLLRGRTGARVTGRRVLHRPGARCRGGGRPPYIVSEFAEDPSLAVVIAAGGPVQGSKVRWSGWRSPR